jgi:hypothetical protein
MKRITIEEIRELLASIAKIDTLVANNEIFIIKEILQKIDNQKEVCYNKYRKAKKNGIGLFLVTTVYIQFGFYFLFPLLQDETPNFLSDYFIPIIYFGFLTIIGLFIYINLQLFIDNWKAIRSFKIIKNTVHFAWLNQLIPEKDDVEFLYKNQFLTFNN